MEAVWWLLGCWESTYVLHIPDYSSLIELQSMYGRAVDDGIHAVVEKSYWRLKGGVRLIDESSIEKRAQITSRI